MFLIGKQFCKVLKMLKKKLHSLTPNITLLSKNDSLLSKETRIFIHTPPTVDLFLFFSMAVYVKCLSYLSKMDGHLKGGDISGAHPWTVVNRNLVTHTQHGGISNLGTAAGREGGSWRVTWSRRISQPIVAMQFCHSLPSDGRAPTGVISPSQRSTS